MSSNEYLRTVRDKTVFIGETKQSFVLTFEPPLAVDTLVDRLSKQEEEPQQAVVATRQHRRSEAEETCVPAIGGTKVKYSETPKGASKYIKAVALLEALGMSVVALDARNNITTLGASKQVLNIDAVEQWADRIGGYTYKRVSVPTGTYPAPALQPISEHYCLNGIREFAIHGGDFYPGYAPTREKRLQEIAAWFEV